jgi:hypothetical protein
MTHDDLGDGSAGGTPFRRTLGRAAEPRLADGAAARIADGAWARADTLRAAAAARTSRGVLPRRIAWSLAVAAALVAAVAGIRGSDPAFAVEGDAVQVLGDAGWESAREVPAGSWVFVEPGTRTAFRRGDAVIEPRGGALLRILAQTGTARGAWRVDLRCGDADVAGSSVTLDVSDALEVVKAADATFLRVTASLGRGLSAAPPELERLVLRATSPCVTVHEGTVRVADRRAAAFLLLGPEESAASVALADGARRLVRESAWTSDLTDRLLSASVVTAADRGPRGLAIVLDVPDAGLHSFLVPDGRRQDVVGQIHLVQAQLAEVALHTASVLVQQTRLPSVVYEHGPAERRTRVVAWTGGGVTVEAPGAAPRTFASLDELRRGAPEVAALFGDKLR